MERLERGGGGAHRKGGRRGVDGKARRIHGLRLPIERLVAGELVNDHSRDEPLGRDTTFDQTFRRRCLDHGLFAGPAGVFWTMRHNHLVLGGDYLETLSGILPDDVHRATTAWTDGTVGRERDVDARKMGRQRSAVGATLLPLCIGRPFLRFLLVLFRVLLSERYLHVLLPQLPLLGIKPFGPPAKLRALELARK